MTKVETPNQFPREGVPSRIIPEDMMTGFTMNGQAVLEHMYFDDSVSSPIQWSKYDIWLRVFLASMNIRFGYKGVAKSLYQAFKRYPVLNQRVLVIGSQTPTYEAILLSRGAYPVTIDYNPIVCDYPKIECKKIGDRLGHIDALLSISSIEHSGLGRYGDSLDPDGDIKEMRRSLDLVKEGSLFFLAVPCGTVDKLVWNAHRIYGCFRLPMLLNARNQTHKWKPIHCFGSPDCLHPVYVLEKVPILYQDLVDNHPSF